MAPSVRLLDEEGKQIGVVTKLEALQKAKELLDSGAAYRKMQQIIRAQGGNPSILPEDIPLGKFVYTQHASKGGRIHAIHNGPVSHIARIAGAPDDKGAGVYLHVHKGSVVKRGDKLFTLYAENRSKLAYARDMLRQLKMLDY